MRSTDFDRRQHVLVRQRPPQFLPYWLGHFLIYLGLLCLSVVAILLLYKVNRIYTSYRIIAQEAAVLQAAPAEFDLATARKSLRSLATELETLSDELTLFLPVAPYLGWIPVYGGDLESLPYLAALSRDLGQVGLLLDDTFTPLLEDKPGGEPAGVLPSALERLSQARAELQEIELKLRQHQIVLDQLDLAELSPSVAQRTSQLKEYLPSVITGLQLAQSLPALLGAETPRTYLIITQNSDELRPSGGYINAAGHIVFAQGQIIEFVMQDSYAVDKLSDEYPYPPDPIHQYMAADYWVIRDAGWSPDFPTAARTVLALYELGQNISADGVIAVDQQALPFLLQALGPVSVEGDRVTSENVIKLMRQHWAPEEGQKLDSEWWLQRKSFMITMAETIRQKFEYNFDAVSVPVLANSLLEAIHEKHLFIYLNDPTWAEFLSAKKWDGSLHPVQGDYLMVVDANMGFNKASAIVERQLNYQVVLAPDGSAQAHTHLFYRHMGQKPDPNCVQIPRYEPVYEQNMDRCYWNYNRLIVPEGAELLNGPSLVVGGQYLLRGEPSTGLIDTRTVGLDKISWGHLFLLPPGETYSFDYNYLLPVNTVRPVENNWAYHLYLQKQPGTLKPSAEITITLPPGAQLLKSDPSPFSQHEQRVTYLFNLRTDQALEILYSLP